MQEAMTPTERRFHAKLDDSIAHSSEELHALLWDDQSDKNGTAVAAHISNLRRKLPNGIDIFSRTVDGVCWYIMVRLTANPYDGKS